MTDHFIKDYHSGAYPASKRAELRLARHKVSDILNLINRLESIIDICHSREEEVFTDIEQDARIATSKLNRELAKAEEEVEALFQHPSIKPSFLRKHSNS